MIKELDIVVLRRDLPDRKLKAGDVGTVVLAHREGLGFEVEFTTLAGDTVAVITIPADDLRSVAAGEIAHARQVA